MIRKKMFTRNNQRMYEKHIEMTLNYDWNGNEFCHHQKIIAFQ